MSVMRVAPLLLLLCLMLIGCQPHGPASSSNDINSDCPKVLEQSRAAGIDYVPTLRRAAKGDDAALSQLFRLTGSDHLDADAQQCHVEALAELLTLLIDDYEEKHHPLPRVSPNESLNALMEERGLKHKDIWPVLGNKGSATEVLSGRRGISKAQAKRLAEFFHVPIDLFV